MSLRARTRRRRIRKEMRGATVIRYGTFQTPGGPITIHEIRRREE